jgi:2-succinyl-6-hydroxy-2,4-cyclohexadiene-1-carboxylate synthase
MARELVLLHGFTHTGASWDPVRAALGERYRAMAPDIRGHGTAADAQPVALEAVIADVAAAAPADAFTLVGYSMGGRIALHVALARPERVRRLVLLGASPGLADASEREERRRADDALADRIEAIGVEAFADEWGRLPLWEGQPERVRAAAHADRLRNTPAGLADALRGLGTGALPSLWDRLGELPMPVVLLAGERDAKFRAIAERMAERIPGARLEIIPGTGHAAHLERPDLVAAAITT